MNDIHTLLAAFPALQSSPLLIGVVNAVLIIYHILTHNRKPKSTTKSRPSNKPFVPEELYTPWSAAWFELQNKAMKEYTKGKVLPNMNNFRNELKHARTDLKNVVETFATHPDSNVIRERIFKIEQILNALDLAGKIGPVT